MLIYFTSRHVCYYMSFQEMMKYWNRAKEGGVKHFKYEELDIGFFCSTKAGNDPSLSGMSAKSIRAKRSIRFVSKTLTRSKILRII